MLIAIEGLIGIGKSTLQQLLLEIYMGKAIEQDFINHPYLQRFYSTPKKYSLETIMIFLFMGYHQILHTDSRNQLMISDFTFQKFLVFGSLDLSSDDYSQLMYYNYNYLIKTVPKPDLIIYLKGSIELVMSRIKLRGREMELGIQPDYLTSLEDAYLRILSDYNQSQLLVVNSDTLDLSIESESFIGLCKDLEEAIPQLSSFRRLNK
jgi:deoxyadenosine/deoxycytidine kinase